MLKFKNVRVHPNALIDYQKLKLAHKLSKNLSFIDWYIKDVFGKPDNYIVLAYEDEDGMLHAYEFKHDEIDGLITKLSELTAPKPKYGLGQTVFICQHDEIKSIELDEIIHDGDIGIKYPSSFIFASTQYR